MSLTEDVIEELYSLNHTKSCCQKAFLCGLLYACRKKDDSNKGYTMTFYSESDAEKAAEIIDQRFSSGGKTELLRIARGGHRAYSLEFHSKALCGVFENIDSDTATDIDSVIGFRCPECVKKFLSGVFISTATLSNPKSGYHLEFSVPTDARARRLSELLGKNVTEPSIIQRKNGVGIYYKSNAKISDVLYFLGALRASFVMTNVSIERDIRNNENRATNCVTSNISRSVDATRKHIEAIELLIERQKLTSLGPDLEYTAKLRLEYDSASLTELALLHQPPISKSGLNSRLGRILSAAAELDKNESV